MHEPIIESTGNIFVDLGFESGEAAILQMRAKLMNDLRTCIESAGMTQLEAAETLGIAQSRVSDLVRGKWEKFSLEMLITLEARAGRRVTLELTTEEPFEKEAERLGKSDKFMQFLAERASKETVMSLSTLKQRVGNFVE